MRKKTIVIPLLLLSVSAATFGLTACNNEEADYYTKGLSYTKVKTDSGAYAYNVAGIGIAVDTDIVIPEVYNGLPVVGIERKAFQNSKINSVTIPEGVTSIGYRAFHSCTATSIVLPDSLTTVENDVFYDCDSLTIYSQAKTQPTNWNSYWRCGRPVVWNYSGTKGVTDAGFAWALRNDNTVTITEYSGSSTDIAIVTSIDGYDVTAVNNYAFRGCSSLTKVEIPSNVTAIGDYAFSKCSNLTIYVEVESKPKGWSYYWNYSNRPVVWNYLNQA